MGKENERTPKIDRRAAPVANQSTNLVGQIGGVSNAVFVRGDLAYIGEGPRLVILDTSTSPTPTLISKTDPFPGLVEGLYISGTYAYVAASGAGLRVIDISDPITPFEVGSYDTPGKASAVHVSGFYAYVADVVMGLRVIDISDPIAPSEVGSYDPGGYVEDVYVSDSYAYLATRSYDEGLVIVDIANPDSPQLEDTCDTGGRTYGVHVAQPYAYAATEDGLWVVDISDPAGPQVTGSRYLAGGGLNVAISGTYAYVGNNGGLQVVNISDQADPKLEGSYTLQSPLKTGGDAEVQVANTWAYLTGGHHGLRVVEISDPADPQEIGGYDVPGYAWGVYASDRYAYVTGYIGNGLWIVDITAPAHQHAGGSFVDPGETPKDIIVSGSYAYLVNSGLAVVDVSDPAHPEGVGEVGIGSNGFDVAFVPPYAYLAAGDVVVVDVSKPTTPTLETSYPITGMAQAIFIAGTRAYVAAGYDGLRVVDVSDPTNPTEVGFYDTPGDARDVYVYGSYAYVADGDSVQVIEITEPITPTGTVALTRTGAYTTGAYDVYVYGSTAYVADCASPNEGVRVLNVSNPSRPHEAGFYDTPDYACIQDLYVSSGYIYVADQHAGLYTFKLNDSDGDGLSNSWETEGLTVTVDGADLFLDLPAMGADPYRKDIFVEVDYMVSPSIFWNLPGISHKPKTQAITRVVEAFANSPVPNPDGSTGINLHVDYGPDSVMNPVTGETWGNQSQATALIQDNELGSQNPDGSYNWNEFDAIKATHLSPARVPVFHYVLFAHNLGGFGSTSGISRGIGASDFIVSLGSWPGNVGTVNQQAGTFMHELGHNLGLRHGGEAHMPNYEPNFLSVMNYAFQMRGLMINSQSGHFDYSRFALPDLDENHLTETVGLTATVANGGPPVADYGTRYWCGVGNDRIVTNVVAIDWNCDSDATDIDIQANVNEGPAWNHDASHDLLKTYNDWENLVFTGGAIGYLGAAPDLPTATKADEITIEEDAELTTLYGVVVIASGNVAAPPGSTMVHTFTITNLGINTDTYTLTVRSNLGWADFREVPVTLTLSAGLSTEVLVPVDVPASVDLEAVDELVLSAISRANPLVEDCSVAYTGLIIHQVFLPAVLKDCSAEHFSKPTVWPVLQR